MNDESIEEEAPAAEPVKVKQVAIAAGLVTAALTAAVAFTVAGAVGVGVAAAGVAGTGYAAHRIRNPRKGTLLHSWLTRTRKTSTKTGTLTWPFTGSQQRRALTRSTSGRASGPSSKSRLPSLTSTRAKRSVALSGGSRRAGLKPATRSGIGTTLGRRSSASTSRSRTQPKHAVSGRKPLGVTRPGAKPYTPTKTPAKASRSTLSGAARRNGTSSKGLRPSTRPGTSLRLANSRSRHRPTMGTPTRRGLLSPGKRNAGRGGMPGPRLFGKGSTPGRSSTTRRTGRGGFNPWLGTRGGQSLGRRSTDSRRTRRAERIGNPLGVTPSRRGGPLTSRLRNRLTPDRNKNTAPNRLRPRPYARRSTGQLVRTSLRLPKRQRGTYGSRNGWRPYVRPNKTQAARARRTLRLRGGVLLRRGVIGASRLPSRYGRWHWDRIWSRIPQAPLPVTHYTEKQSMKAPTGPKHKTPNPVPSPTITAPAVVRDISLMPIKQNGNVIYVSSPNDLIREAFQQMAQFHPTGATDVEAWLIDLQSTLVDVGQSFGVLADQMRDGMPFAAPVADSVREIGVAVGAVSGIAQSAHQTMRVAHVDDFKRFEEPRPDEGMWNPENNR